jgi:hypothetical protein
MKELNNASFTTKTSWAGGALMLVEGTAEKLETSGYYERIQPF